MKIASIKKILIVLACLGAMWPVMHASASVVLKNTRVIYPANNDAHTIEFTNTDPHPNIVQLWIDAGDEQSTPKTADAPFVVMPPIFKVNANTSQSARLMYTSEPLAQDKESLFYLNFLVIPPNIDNGNRQSKLAIVLRNRVKVFYRPDTIIGTPSAAVSGLKATPRYHENGALASITLTNNAGYFVNLSHTAITVDNQRYTSGAVMIAPRSKAVVDYTAADVSSAPAGAREKQSELHYVAINDYGAQVSGTIPLSTRSHHEN